MNFGMLKWSLILALGNVLALSSFASSYTATKPQTEVNRSQNNLESSKSTIISNKFNDHIKNLHDKSGWVFQEKYKSSVKNILTEITNSMLDTSSYDKSMHYSDGRTIAEFYEEDNFLPISKYKGENWNYVVLMNLLQNMRNADIQVINADKQKQDLLNDVVMDIRNAHIRKASQYDYDQKQYVQGLTKAAQDIRQYFDCLDLWNFVLQIKSDYYKLKSPVQENRTQIPMQITKDSLPKGIRNPGTFCYLIAALQCLYNSAPIRTAIQDLSELPQNKLAKSINDIFIKLKRDQNDKTPSVNLYDEALEKNGLALLAIDIFQRKTTLGNQDPSEAIGIILDKLIDEEIKVDLESVKKKYQNPPNSSAKAKEEETLRANSTIGKICNIQYGTVTICPECKNRSIKKDPPTTRLTLPTVSPEQLKLSKEKLSDLLETKHPPLQELIKWSEYENKLEKTDNYLCEKCKNNKSALQRSVLCNLPKVLVIELKRAFVYEQNPYKDSGAISCPDALKIRQYKYRLRSFVYGGDLKKGHIMMEGYADDGTPYKADDNNVSTMSKLEDKGKAQMLVYELME